ncbi:MAG: acetyl-CoA carboxylase biotin carboxyl carrier protein subunit [Bacteroidia bacterium]|nr:acetyl-CoA carboxylase biotin carboxyl carrier protein subunit [Bacteroidia bacterium]
MFKAEVNGKNFEIRPSGDGFLLDGKEYAADILEYRKNRFHVIHNLKTYDAEIISFNKEEKSVVIRVNNNHYSVVVRDQYDELLKQMGMDFSENRKVNDIKAPMPGLVLNVLVEAGQLIKKGDALVVLEAMKMENILKAPADGVIRKVQVEKGDKVEKNQVMVLLG